MSPKQTFHQLHSHPTPSLLVLFLLRMGVGVGGNCCKMRPKQDYILRPRTQLELVAVLRFWSRYFCVLPLLISSKAGMGFLLLHSTCLSHSALVL